jgi:hypothetical protein
VGACGPGSATGSAQPQSKQGSSEHRKRGQSSAKAAAEEDRPSPSPSPRHVSTAPPVRPPSVRWSLQRRAADRSPRHTTCRSCSVELTRSRCRARPAKFLDRLGARTAGSSSLRRRARRCRRDGGAAREEARHSLLKERSARASACAKESDLRADEAMADFQVGVRRHGVPTKRGCRVVDGCPTKPNHHPLQHTESFPRILVPCHLVLQVRLCKQPGSLLRYSRRSLDCPRTLRPIGSGAATRSVQRETWPESQYRLQWAAGGEPAAWRHKNPLRSPTRRRRPSCSPFTSEPYTRTWNT